MSILNIALPGSLSPHDAKPARPQTGRPLQNRPLFRNHAEVAPVAFRAFRQAMRTLLARRHVIQAAEISRSKLSP